MKVTSENLALIILEFSSKLHIFVSKNYPLEKATSIIVCGRLMSVGQTCIALDYVKVNESEVGILTGNASKRPQRVASIIVLGVTDEMIIDWNCIDPLVSHY